MLGARTRVADGGADELEGDALAEELLHAVEEGGGEVGEVEGVLPHQHHRALHGHALGAAKDVAANHRCLYRNGTG